ncbi:AAA family ATPase [Microcoleus sp. FACHB-53]|nr:AAA family ATPase [Microcoleus sp. FACHB-53]
MTAWTASPTQTFLNELLNLPRKVSKLVPKKIALLEKDPTSAKGDAKKLKDYDNVYRVRINDYRLFYTFGQGWIKLLSIRKRDERTYTLELPEFETPETSPNAAILQPQTATVGVSSSGYQVSGKTESETTTSQPQVANPKSTLPNSGITTALPYKLTKDLLQKWQIPSEYWTDLLNVSNSEAILELDISHKYINRILDNLYPRPLEDIETQPQYLLKDLEDLDRFVEGTLPDFLLKLNPEQEKLLNFSGSGPILVKGGPGTGKSTLALYRVQKMRDLGYQSILFTTYTNALVTYSEQLLSQLLGESPAQAGVKVATVDSLIYRRYAQTYGKPKFAESDRCLAYLETALQTTELPAKNTFDRQVRRQALERLGSVYILQEILSVIEAWGVSTLEEYQELARRGRGYPLKANIREALWAVYQTWEGLMAKEGCITWEQLRRKALDAALQSSDKPYQAVIIDEAQDLSPVALRFLLALTPNLEGIYLTADASQSLYQRGFSWKQIHTDLKVSGRSLLLKRNYRNTQQIAAACTTILQDTEAGDTECLYQQPSPYTGNWPTLLLVDDPDREARAIKDFLITAAKQFRLPLHAGAILCPHQQSARRIAKQLANVGLKAQFVSGKTIDINSPHINVLTLHSAKGLEFPFVVVMGLQEGSLPQLEPDLPSEEVSTVLSEQRRLFYVGCSRAMRSLMVCGSPSHPSQFLNSLTEPYWQKQAI